MKKIIPLNDLTINQIAAGEVIERPASVIKEMVENSIDAGAKNITIEIKSGGISEIVVTDDGSGIDKDDMETAFERHATSKIKSADDLNTIYTMGFRGEALASIAAISSVEMISKTPEEKTGYRLLIKGGKVLEKSESAAQNGTKITVQDLFYNTPVRYKFLKKDYTEAGFIEDIVTKIALVNKNVAIKLISSGKVLLQTSGNGKVQDLIYNIYGKEIASAILETEFEYEGIKVTGVVGKPNIAKANRSGQIFFVNNRAIKDRNLNVAVDQAFREVLPYGKFGFAILNIEIDPKLVNVNIHPAKTEVKFEEPNKVFSAVNRTIKDALSKMNITDEDKELFKVDTAKLESKVAVESKKIEMNLSNARKVAEGVSNNIFEPSKTETNITDLSTRKAENVENNVKKPEQLNEEKTDTSETVEKSNELKAQEKVVEQEEKDEPEERKKGLAGLFQKHKKESKEQEESNPLLEVYNLRKSNAMDLTKPINFGKNSEEGKYFTESTMVDEPIEKEPAQEEFKKEDTKPVEPTPLELAWNTPQPVSEPSYEPAPEPSSELVPEPSSEPAPEPAVANEEIVEKKIELDGTTISSDTRVLDFDINEALRQKTQGLDSIKKIETQETKAIPTTRETVAQETQAIESLNEIEKKEENENSEEKPEKPLESTVPSVEAVENITSKILEMKMNNLDSTQMIDTAKVREEMSNQEITPEFANMYKETFGVDANEIRKEKENLEREREKINVSKDFVEADNVKIEEEKDINFKLIGIAFDTNIIIEFNNEMYIVDTEAAKERLIYENVCSNYYDERNKDSQSLLLPDIVTATDRQMDVARENKEMFRKAGFDYEEFGENSIKLMAVPSVCEELNTKILFTDILDAIEPIAVNDYEEKERKFIVTVACKVAENERKILDEKEINLLIRQLLSLEEPFAPKTGRPTAIKMKRTDIEKKFARRK